MSETMRRKVGAKAAPARGAFVAAGGLSLHHVAAGPEGGAPLVLLHGASGNLRDWTLSVFDRLARERRVIAFDRPGFGFSDPGPRRGWRLAEQGAALRAGLAALGIRRYVLVGHSWSGALVLDWALRNPHEVAGLGILAGATMDWGGALAAHYRALAAPVLGGALAHLVPRLVGERRIRAALAEIFAPQPVPPRYRAEGGIELALRPATFLTNARALNALHGQVARNAPQYGRIACPATVIHGMADRIVPARVHAEPLARRLPDARLHLMQGVGHMPHHAEPERVARLLLSLPG